MNRDFLFYQLLSKQNEISEDGAVFPSINRVMIGEIQVVVPPLEEQQRIVSILDEAFENVSNSSKRVEQKLIDAKELFSSLVEEKYTEKEGKWNQKTISNYARLEMEIILKISEKIRNG